MQNVPKKRFVEEFQQTYYAHGWKNPFRHEKLMRKVLILW